MEQQTHFFKVLMFDFHQKLWLPPAFCVKVADKKFKWAKLKSRRGTWKVRVSRDENGGICFGEVGWPEFVDSHSLSIADFLMFEHVGHFHFNVFIFDPSACEKEFPDSTLNHEDKPHFAVTMQRHHAAVNKPYLNIPIEFVRSNNLKGKTSAIVRNDRGHVWPMNIVITNAGYFKMHLGKGWCAFYEGNELKDGDVCVFYLNPDSSSSLTISFDSKIFPSTV